MAKVTLYGIKNCDTVKKARHWLDSYDIPYEFHDFRRDGLEMSKIHDWFSKVDSCSLLNKKSTTWRNLPPEEKELAENETSLVKLLADNPTLIKRPVLENSGSVQVGFKPENYQRFFNS